MATERSYKKNHGEFQLRTWLLPRGNFFFVGTTFHVMHALSVQCMQRTRARAAKCIGWRLFINAWTISLSTHACQSIDRCTALARYSILNWQVSCIMK